MICEMPSSFESPRTLNDTNPTGTAETTPFGTINVPQRGQWLKNLEAPLEDGLDDVAQDVVHHPVAEGAASLPSYIEGRGGDEAGLALLDGEVVVGSRTMGLGAQLLVQPPQIGLQVQLEGDHAILLALAAPASLAEGLVEVLEGLGRIEYLLPPCNPQSYYTKT